MSKRGEKKSSDHLAKRLVGTLIDSGIDEVSLITILRRFSIYTRENPVSVLEREPVINGVRVRCVDDEAIDVAGRSGTDEDGRMTWRISDFICLGHRTRFREPICFLATPHSKTPIHITTHVSRSILPDAPDDVVVEVFSWDSNGEPAPRVAFSWRCRVLTFDIPIVD